MEGPNSISVSTKASSSFVSKQSVVTHYGATITQHSSSDPSKIDKDSNDNNNSNDNDNKNNDNNNNKYRHDQATTTIMKEEHIPLIPLSYKNMQPKNQVHITTCWSYLVFDWFVPILTLGSKLLSQNESLEFSHLQQVIPFPQQYTTHHITHIFLPYWNTSPFSSSSSISMALFHSFGKDFICAGGYKLIHDLGLFVGPHVLQKMIHFVRTESAPLSEGIFWTVTLAVSQIIMTFCLRHYFFQCYITGLQCRTGLIQLIYQAALRHKKGGMSYTSSPSTTTNNHSTTSQHSEQFSTGEIINLISIDAQRMQDLTTYLHAIWYSLLQIGLALYFISQQVGLKASMGGVILMLLLMPLTKCIAQKLGSVQARLLKAKDARTQLNTELLNSIKIIKLQAWEEPYEQRLKRLRNDELNELWNYLQIQAISVLIWSTTPLAVAVATFGSYVIISKKRMEVSSALTTLALLDLLRFPLFVLPQIIQRIVEAKISLQRIQRFLLLTTQDDSSSSSFQNANKDFENSVGIRFQNATFVYDLSRTATTTTSDKHDKQWEIRLLRLQLKEVEEKLSLWEKQQQPSSQQDFGQASSSNNDIWNIDKSSSSPSLPTYDSGLPFHLSRINLDCHRGEMIAIVGGVGAGKSTLLQAILGELLPIGIGTRIVKGTISYMAQSPFILNDTLRNNILFQPGKSASHVVDEDLYQASIASCALTHDLQSLPAGEDTEIGEKGITLSGGQKARVALARTVYRQADIALLDDPLAAVDAHVGKHLFQKCIIEQLLLPRHPGAPKKSVILVTNALQYLNHPMVDKIVVLQDGRIWEQGTYAELSNTPNSLFSQYLDVMNESGVMTSSAVGDAIVTSMSSNSLLSLGSENDEVDVNNDSTINNNRNNSSLRKSAIQSFKINETLSNATAEGHNETKPHAKGNNIKEVGELMTNESKERVVGKVSAQTYLSWSKAAGGIWIPVIILIVFAMVECVNVSSKWWLTYWSAHGSDANQIMFLGIFAGLNLAAALANFLRLILLYICSLRASRQMFVRLLSAVLHAPMSFFDTTPIGRIINRFSGDMNTVDSTLIETVRSYIMTLFTILSTVIVISFVTPIFTVCLIPIIAYYTIQQNYFTSTYRELKRLDSIGRSPIYALLGETLDGVTTIRAFGAQSSFSEKLCEMLDRQQHAYYLISAAQSWLGIRLEMVGTMIITFTCLACVWQHSINGGNEVFAGLAGLAISYSLSVTQSLNWSVRMASDFEANMVAVERLEQYCSIPSEAPRVTLEDSNLACHWPERGEIIFSGVKLRYRPELDLVLKGLDIHIPAGAKVGVVGRTGAGKSTLMVALLRLVELCDGRIIIDGIDHSLVGLAKLRSKIAVIPQDPVLFSGTIRSNLDPFDEFTDERLIDVLQRVGLYYGKEQKLGSSNSLSSMGGKVSSLQDRVTDGGGDYSVGQRQLIVIARALLSESNIVIMDEATAAVDAETDKRIQKIMRHDFCHATCLTVAHRIHTITDSDYILVMSDGRAEEFDTPTNLLQKGGLFRDLVNAASMNEQ